jgi:site-specific DNA-methyltransferase (adenine-specific)
MGDAIDWMKRIKTETVDHIITDPPFGIEFGKGHATYNRDDNKVIGGYEEWDTDEYFLNMTGFFSEASRVLRPNGNLLVFSSWNRLPHLFECLTSINGNYFDKEQILQQMGHMFWQYQFGVWTTKKPVNSHYHLLWFAKHPAKNPTYNYEAMHPKEAKGPDGKSLNYADRQSVFQINKPYRKGEIKYPTELPIELCNKLVQYFTNEGDIVLDPFAGSGRIGQALWKHHRFGINIESNGKVLPYMLNNIYGYPYKLGMEDKKKYDKHGPFIIDIANLNKILKEHDRNVFI